MLNKTIIREIKKSFGRYIAILAIVALGVGFFSGLKVCKEAMIETGDKYLKGVSLYDFRGISTLGYDDDQLKYIEDLDYVSEAEGSITMDALLSMNNEDALVFRALSIPEKINLPTLVTGRMPSSSNECLLDNMWSTRAEDLIGKKLTVSENNDEDTLEAFKSHEFTVVGLCRSPLYMNYERGTTSLGGGTVSGFIYVPKDSFDLDYYTEIYTTVDEYHQIYSPEYEEKIEKIFDYEVYIFQIIRKLRETPEYRDFLEFYVASKYLLGIVCNGKSKTRNGLIGMEMMSCLNRMGNKYAFEVMKIVLTFQEKYGNLEKFQP